jgi:hypothetical protein
VRRALHLLYLQRHNHEALQGRQSDSHECESKGTGRWGREGRPTKWHTHLQSLTTGPSRRISNNLQCKNKEQKSEQGVLHMLALPSTETPAKPSMWHPTV